MKFFKQIILILVIFFKTGNLLSENELFNVNNIILEKKEKTTSDQLANQAITEAFNVLIDRILLNQDTLKFSKLSSKAKRNLVIYYNISKNKELGDDKISFNVKFDKEKLHDLFYKNDILYSDITDKEFYILPILIKKNDIFIFSKNYFYENWNVLNEDDLIEFILPLENIEIIQNINKSRNNLYDLQISSLLKEYSNKNIGIVLIETYEKGENKIYLKARIQNKNISKSLNLKNESQKKIENFNKIISETKYEITNLVKLQNLIDIRTPSFLNAELELNKNTNLVLLNSKISNVDSVENIYVQNFNKNRVNLKIKYLGKLEKIIYQLKKEKISLKLTNDKWIINLL